jgi:hypothetical protein
MNKKFFLQISVSSLVGLFITTVATLIHMYWVTCPELPPPCLEGLGMGIEFIFFAPLGFILGFIGGIISFYKNLSLSIGTIYILGILSIPLYMVLIEVILYLLYDF